MCKVGNYSEITGTSRECGFQVSETDLFCPLTNQLPKEAVSLSDGYTYDQEALRKALAEKPNKSPVTGADLLAPVFGQNMICNNFTMPDTPHG